MSLLNTARLLNCFTGSYLSLIKTKKKNPNHDIDLVWFFDMHKLSFERVSKQVSARSPAARPESTLFADPFSPLSTERDS